MNSPDLAQAILGPHEVEIFENLYAAYAEDARRAAFRILHDRDLAADAAHSAYIELLRYILAGNRWHGPDQARSAVVRNANWAALKLLRTRRRRPEAAIDAAGELVSEDEWARAEARALCQHVVQQLRPAQRTALQLRFVEGLTSPQCAARLDVSVGAFEERLARAIRAARRVAAGMGLAALLTLTRRRAIDRVRQAGTSMRRFAAPRAARAAGRAAGLAGGVALVCVAVNHPAALTSAQPAGVALHVQPTPAAASAGDTSDTLDTSVIRDGLRLGNGVVALLAEGRRCQCGIVFVSHDEGRTWTAVPGPAQANPRDRLAVATTRSSVDVFVVRADGSTWSSQALDALAPALSPADAGALQCSAGATAAWWRDCGSGQ